MTAPEKHVVFLSFLSVAILGEEEECDGDGGGDEEEDGDYLVLLSGPCGSRGSRRVWTHCTMHRPQPYLLRPDPDPRTPPSLSLYFVSNGREQSTGFRAQFSFHNLTARPERLPGGSWNCSVRHWPDFRHHFPCDLVPQCAGGEDEARCPYTTRRCGEGRLQAGGRCYAFVTLRQQRRRKIAWTAANARCQRLGGARLASLETPQERSDVLRVLRLADFNLLHLGLKTAETSLPLM